MKVQIVTLKIVYLHNIMKAKTKSKGTKKYDGGALLAAGAIQGAIGIGQSIYGARQSRRGREELRRLIADRPQPFVPSATRRQAAEPISQELLRSEEMGSQRRTAQAADALGRAGGRAMIGAMPQIMEQERIGDVERTGRLEQLRTNALAGLGQAEMTQQQMENQLWQQQLQGAQMEAAAGDQNIMTGIQTLGKGTAAGIEAKTRKKAEDGMVVDAEEKPAVTEGEESHDSNPLLLVKQDGTPALDKETGEQIELTGDETVINSEQRGEMEKLADKGDAKGLKKYIKELFSKKRFK